jgi:hypothetical protein
MDIEEEMKKFEQGFAYRPPITKQDQLKNKDNFIGENGNLYLVRCMACPDAGEFGTENYALNVSSGICSWCGWKVKGE